MGTPDFDFLGDSNPRALGKAPGGALQPEAACSAEQVESLIACQNPERPNGFSGFFFL